MSINTQCSDLRIPFIQRYFMFEPIVLVLLTHSKQVGKGGLDVEVLNVKFCNSAECGLALSYWNKRECPWKRRCLGGNMLLRNLYVLFSINAAFIDTRVVCFQPQVVLLLILSLLQCCLKGGKSQPLQCCFWGLSLMCDREISPDPLDVSMISNATDGEVSNSFHFHFETYPS